MTLPEEANLLIRCEEFELAQSVKRELLQLRSRSAAPTSEDIMLIARKTGITGASRRAGGSAVDQIRAEARSAICKLAAAIEGNTRLIEENRPAAPIDTSSLWARAIDLGQVWMRASEPVCRELPERATTCRDIEARPIQVLPQAPTLAPTLGIGEATDPTVNICFHDRGKEIVKALSAIPNGSMITFAIDDICFTGEPIVQWTEAHRQVEHLAEACKCSISFRQKSGTITFCRKEA